MSAASKHTALAAASFVLVVALALSGAAAGSRGHWREKDRDRRDKVAPSAPTNLRATSATPSSVALAWSASTDNVAVAGYYLYVDQNRVQVTGTSYTVHGLQCGRSVDVWMVAFDTSRNRSLATTATVSTAACPDVQPPSAPSGFRQQATTQNGAVLTWSPSTDDVGIVGYDVYRDVSLVTRTAQPTATLGGLSCGSAYQYQVDAYDAAGNHSSRSSVWVQTAACGDLQAPTAPSGVAVTGHTTSSLTLSWTASKDDVGVTGYAVSANGAPAMNVTSTTATLTLLSCGTSYSVSIVAYDAAGNRSSAAVASATTDPCPAPAPPPPPPPPPSGDTTPPTQPGGVKLASIDQASATLGWSASTDDVGVTGYDVYVDGSRNGTVAQPGATISGLTCGKSYTFAVDAYDAAGNHSTRASVTGSTAACSTPGPAADTSPPTSPAGLTVASATRTSISLGWTASTDNVGVTGYGVYQDGTGVSTVAQPGATVSGLTCGSAYMFAVDAFDAAGNGSTRAQVTASTSACADSQPPSAPTGVAASSRTANSIALTWSSSSDNVGVTGYGLYKDGSQVGTVTGNTGIFSGLACNTNYTLAVDAYDAAGNHSTKTAVMVSTTACPDSTPPSTPTGLAGSNVTQTSVDLSWNASSDNVGVTGYDVFRGGTKMATVTSRSSSQTGLACGTTYTLGVVAFDAAGNRSQQAQITVSTSACAPAPPPPAPSGTVLWRGDASGGNLSQYNYVVGRTSVVSSDGSVTPRSGNPSMIRLEDRYNECAPWTCGMNIALAQNDSPGVPGANAVGDDFYMGWSLYLPNGFQYVPDTYGNAIVEWHAGSKMEQAPIHFLLDGYQKGAFSLDLHTDCTGYNPKPVWGGLKFDPVDPSNPLGQGKPMITGRWVDFVIHIRWAKDNSGLLEGWMDGVKRFSWSGVTWGPCVTGVYPQVDYYRDNYNSTAVLYVAGMKVGTTYPSVAP